MEIDYWFSDLNGAVIIVSPYYEGDTLFNFVNKFKPLQEGVIYQIFG
jgi:hypothetical protein